MIRKTFFAALLASSASFAAAQPAPSAGAQATTTPTVAAPAAPAAAPDPARLAAARQFVDAMLPSGIVERALIEGFRAGMRDELADPENRRRDPHLAERLRLAEPIVIAEGRRILADVDPNARAVLADFYARRMSAAELAESAGFFASPTGRRFYEGVFNIGVSEDYNRAMQALVQALTPAMAGIEQRFAEVAAQMPPIPGMPTPPAAARTAPPAASPPAAVPLPAAPAVDQARLASARRMLDAMWPSSLSARPLNLLPTIEMLTSIRLGDFGIPIPPQTRISPDSTAADLATTFDPHFRSRLPVLTRFAASELARAMTAMEPVWKQISAPYYAREFTVAELDAMTRFFQTPAGRSVMEQSYRAYEDPALVRGLVMLVPRIVLQLPAAMQRVEQATAHLPRPTPPVPPAETEGAGDDGAAAAAEDESAED